MQCNCGAKTITRYISKNYQNVLWYEQCEACGRQSVMKVIRVVALSHKMTQTDLLEQASLLPWEAIA